MPSSSEPTGDDGDPAGNGRSTNGGGVIRGVFLALGVFFVGVGFVGAFLPLLPSTVFFIIAAACFARASPRLERWLLTHRTIGPPLIAWRERGAIPRPAKIAAWTGIALGFAAFELVAHPALWLTGAVGVLLLGVAVWIGSRPD